MMQAQNVPLFGFGDGYAAIEVAKSKGWRAVPSWGRDGWDLGGWPIVVVFMRERGDQFEVAEYVEGDVTHFIFDTEDERTAHVDSIAFWHWRHNGEPWVEGLVFDRPAHLKGPFSWERLERERTA